MATIEELLARLDLGKFVDAFKAQDIDLETASKLSEEDFKELGLTIGARKKLVEALKAGPAAAAPAAPSPLKKPAAAPIAAKPAAAKPAPVAAPVAQPKPAAAVPTGPATINPCSFKWLNKAEQWPNGAPSKFERLRVADGPNPQYATLSCRDEFNYVSVVNLSNGGQFALKPKNARGRRFDADICGDIVVCCGDDEDHVLDIYSLSGRKQTGEYHGPSEGGLSYIAIYNAASGAPQVAGATYNYGKIFFFDIATAARCAKPIVLNDCNPRDMKRDPHNPTCFMAANVLHGSDAYSDGGMYYIDTRVNKVVKQIYGLSKVNTIRLPHSNPGQGIVSATDENTRIFDIGMEKFIHTLPSQGYCSALYKNVAVCYANDPQGEWGFLFYDLAGAPENIEDFVHDLRGGNCNELDIVNGKVYATSGGSCYTMAA